MLKLLALTQVGCIRLKTRRRELLDTIVIGIVAELDVVRVDGADEEFVEARPGRLELEEPIRIRMGRNATTQNDTTLLAQNGTGRTRAEKAERGASEGRAVLERAREQG